jgi:hypothetical protein
MLKFTPLVTTERFYPLQFSEFFETWFSREKDMSKNMVVGSITCKSCYDKKNKEIAESSKRKPNPKPVTAQKKKKQ